MSPSGMDIPASGPVLESADHIVTVDGGANLEARVKRNNNLTFVLLLDRICSGNFPARSRSRIVYP